jgi:Zn-dependent protease
MSAEPGTATRPRGGLSVRLGGIPVLMPWSGLLGVGLIAFLWSGRFDIDPDLPLQTGALAVGFAVLFYVSVLGHELAHAWVAGAAGYPVHSITLWVLGGFTSYERRTESALREGLIAASGPAASILIGLGAGVVSRSGLATDLRVYVVAEALAVSNILLGIYNALPGLPLDGGAVLKSFVWGLTRDENRGTIVAAWSGRVVAVLIFALPLALAWRAGRDPDLSAIVVGGLIAAYLYAGASDALKRTKLQARVPGLSARALARRAVLVPHDLPLAEALRRLGELGAGAMVVVDSDGRPQALSNEQSVSAVPLERRPWVPVSSVSTTFDHRAVLTADLTGADLLGAMQAFPAPQYLVVDPGGPLVGVLTTADVERALVS